MKSDRRYEFNFWIFFAPVYIIILIFLCVPSTADCKSKRFIIDSEIKSYIGELTQLILAAAGLSENAIRVHIIHDDSISAFVTKGGKLFLHTGLLRRTDRPSQLLGVLAHEIGHIAAGHLVRRSQAIHDTSNAAILGMVLGTITAVTTGRGDAGNAIIHGSQKASLASLYRHSRSQEAAADQAALRYLASANISPKGLLEFLQTLEGQELLSLERRSPYVRTHPHTIDRIELVKNQLVLSPDVRDTLPREQQIKHARMIAKLRGFILSPKETFRLYPVSDKSVVARYARAIGLYKNADIDKSLTVLDNLIDEQPNDAYFWELKGQLLLETNQKRKAHEAYTAALLLSENNALIRMQLARTELAINTPESYYSALQHLKLTVRSMPNSSFSWHQLAIAQGRLGHKALARLSLAEEALLKNNVSLARKNAITAKNNMKKGSSSYQRALDIIHFSEQLRLTR